MEYTDEDKALAQAWVDGYNEGVRALIPQIYLDAYDHLVREGKEVSEYVYKALKEQT